MFLLICPKCESNNIEEHETMSKWFRCYHCNFPFPLVNVKWGGYFGDIKR